MKDDAWRQRHYWVQWSQIFGATRCHMKGGQPTKTRGANHFPHCQMKMKSQVVECGIAHHLRFSLVFSSWEKQCCCCKDGVCDFVSSSRHCFFLCFRCWLFFPAAGTGPLHSKWDTACTGQMIRTIRRPGSGPRPVHSGLRASQGFVYRGLTERVVIVTVTVVCAFCAWQFSNALWPGLELVGTRDRRWHRDGSSHCATLAQPFVQLALEQQANRKRFVLLPPLSFAISLLSSTTAPPTPRTANVQSRCLAPWNKRGRQTDEAFRSAKTMLRVPELSQCRSRPRKSAKRTWPHGRERTLGRKVALVISLV